MLRGDLELGLALSVSTEIERRRSCVIISTQEYQEDELRRRSLIENKSQSDMFASTDEENGTKEDDQSNNTEEAIMSKEYVCEEDTEEEEQEEEEGERFSQYVPPVIRWEREEKKRKMEEQNSLGTTLRKRRVGDVTLNVQETKSEHVGIKPKPTVVLKLANQTVGEESQRMMRSMDTPSSSPQEYSRLVALPVSWMISSNSCLLAAQQNLFSSCRILNITPPPGPSRSFLTTPAR